MQSLSRIQLLISQSKFDLAEKEVRLYLTENPNFGDAHALLAIALLGLSKKKESVEEAKAAVGLAPYSSFCYYVLCKCYIGVDDIVNAEAAIRNAIRIAPDDGDFFNILALILHDTKRVEEALETINKALSLNPEEPDYKNTKSIILRKLNRKSEAASLADESLKDNPESSMAFAVKGWAVLEKGDVDDALVCFKSSLAIDPTNEYAKSGLVMALKAQNFLFNQFYRFSLWVSSLSSGMRMAIVFGLIIFVRILNSVQEKSPELKPILIPIIAAYFVFVFLTWTINPIYNLFLRLNKYGKYALDKGDVLGSNFILGIVIAAAIQLGLYLMTPFYPGYGAIGTIIMMIPVAGAFSSYGRKSFKKLMAYNAVLTLLLLLFIINGIKDSHSTEMFLMLHIIGIVAFTWIVQFIKD